MAATFHSGRIKKSITVRAADQKVWRSISDIAGLDRWVVGVRTCTLKRGTKRGIGAVRHITFSNGKKVEEHIIAWDPKKSISYMAVSGLPLRVYVANVSLQKRGARSTKITWQSYLNSKKMSQGEFGRFVEMMEGFYEESLKNLKTRLEK